MASCGIVPSSTLADAQIQIEPDETVQNEPPSSGILDERSSKVVPDTQPIPARNSNSLQRNDLSVLILSAAYRHMRHAELRVDQATLERDELRVLEAVQDRAERQGAVALIPRSRARRICPNRHSGRGHGRIPSAAHAPDPSSGDAPWFRRE
jgi:hypothetical protein